jgi:hypothetical protein
VSVEIRGAEQLAALSKALKDAGEKDLQRELSKAITAAVKPVKPAVQKSARRILPKRGGLAARVAKASITTRKRSGPRIAGVRVVATSRDSLRQIDRGFIRHPVFGNRERWVTQRVQPGWFTEPTEAMRDDVQRALIKAMNDVAKKLSRR